MENKYNALSLRAVDYGESDKIVTLLTLERGKIVIKARGVRSAKAKLRYAVSPLCFGMYIIAEKGGKGTLAACDMYDSFPCVAENLDKFYIASVIIECADKFSEEDGADSQFFFFIINSVKNLCYGEQDPLIAGATFLIKLLAALGYAVNSGDRALCNPCFDYGCGMIVEHNDGIKNYEKLTVKEAKLFADLSGGSINNGALSTEIKKIFFVLAKYIFFTTGKKLFALKELIAVIR